MSEKNKEKVIDALLSTDTIAAAAKKAGVGEATVYRFLRDDTFKNEYRNARRDVVESTVGQIQGVAASAVKALKKNLTCGIPSAEIRAAQIILDTAYKGVEMIDLQMRLEILEAEQQKMNETIGKKNY
jgi:DNA-binding MurR/RpiR family transcriptional regulator